MPAGRRERTLSIAGESVARRLTKSGVTMSSASKRYVAELLAFIFNKSRFLLAAAGRIESHDLL